MPDLDPRLEEAARILGEGDPDEAARILLEAWSSDTGNIDLAVSYACLLARIGREAEAEELFATLADESPDDSRAWNNWGFLLLEKGDIAGAVYRLEKALRLVPDDFEALVNLGIALDRDGRTDESLQRYRQAAEINPHSPVVYNNMGAALWRSGNAQEALGAFRTALTLDPRDSSAANNMGIIKMAEGEFVQAAEFFRQALEIDPESTAAQKNLDAAGERMARAAKSAARPDDDKEKKCEKPPSLF